MYKCFRYLLVLLLAITSLNAAGSSIERDLDKVLQNLELRFATSDKIYCAPASRKHSSDYPHADHMLDVASANNTIIFVHGFVATQYGGHESLDDMVSDWRYHIDILDGLKSDTSYCVVSWDSEHGFDDPENTLSKFLAAFNFVARDMRLDSNTKNITLIGYSAGGNYIKHSFIDSQIKAREVRKLIGRVQPKNLKTRIVTLGTPHLGSNFADTAQMTSYFAAIAAALILGDKGVAATSVLPHKANSRGAGQLKSIHLNDDLYDLNRTFAKSFPKKNIYALGSTGDKNVPYRSATPDFATPIPLKKIAHNEFLRPYLVDGYSDLMLLIYSGRINKSEIKIP